MEKKSGLSHHNWQPHCHRVCVVFQIFRNDWRHSMGELTEKLRWSQQSPQVAFNPPQCNGKATLAKSTLPRVFKLCTVKLVKEFLWNCSKYMRATQECLLLLKALLTAFCWVEHTQPSHSFTVSTALLHEDKTEVSYSILHNGCRRSLHSCDRSTRHRGREGGSEGGIERETERARDRERASKHMPAAKEVTH